jgi:E3 ubiquitin-protein ligase SHPRH
VETFLAPSSEVIKMRKSRSNPEFDSFLDLLSSINLPESFGTKLDTIVRHIIHLKTLDPLVKVLIFSQWEQVLELLTKSLDLNHVSWIRMENNHRMHKGKAVVEFQNDANLTAFLLNSKSQSSGLTLVAASHVFIVEPILSGLDQQAINRVHRIGQTKPTFVWRYIIYDTVEERIWEMLESNVEKNHSWLENEEEERGDEILRRTIGL